MKFITTVFVACVLSASLAFASIDRKTKACTADGKAVSWTVKLVDGTSAQTSDEIVTTFRHVAEALPVQVLLSYAGFELFSAALTDEDKEAIEAVSTPLVTGDCKKG